MNIFNLIKRIIALPFVLALILVSYNLHGVRNAFLFLLHGGEWITYKKQDKKCIQDIYLELKNKP